MTDRPASLDALLNFVAANLPDEDDRPAAPAPLSPKREQEIRQAQPGDWLPGPWTIRDIDGTGDEPGHWELVHHQTGKTLATMPDWAGNLALWAADAHDAVPELLAEVTRLRAELNQAQDDRTGACLARWEEEQENARLRLALASAQRGRREARAALERMTADRRAVLREAADAAEQTFVHGVTPAVSERDEIWDQAVRAVAAELRRMADEAQPGTAPAAPVASAERRARYEAAFGPNMRLGLQDAELFDEPGAQRIGEWVEWITNAVVAVADAEQAELRAQLAGLEASGAVVCDAEGCAIPHTPGCPKNSRSITRPVRYDVALVPESDINHGLYALTVEDRGAGRWAVVRHRQCLGRSGEWSYELRPSERDDEWLTEHRFDLETALRLAEETAPKVTVNGVTAAEVATRTAEGSSVR